MAGLTAFRVADGRTGLFARFIGPEGRELMQELLDDQAALEAELGQPVCFEFGDTTAGSEKVAGAMVVDFRAVMLRFARRASR